MNDVRDWIVVAGEGCVIAGCFRLDWRLGLIAFGVILILVGQGKA